MVQSFPRGLTITAVAAKDLTKKKRFGAQGPAQVHKSRGQGWSQAGMESDVSCHHEKTGVKVGSGDGLIGTCKIDLKQTLLLSDSELCDQWFPLMNDGKESGMVHLRLQLCEPKAEDDTAEFAPVRIDRKIKSNDKKDKKDVSGNADKTSASSSFSPAQPTGVQRAPTLNRLPRPRSMDLFERKPTIKFQEPTQRRAGSRSLEEVRDAAGTPTANSSDGDSRTDAEDDKSISSPKQTFTLQDSEGSINPLNVLIAPFDPSWLEPTPPILRRALSAQFYYEDLQTQMQHPSHEIFPRPQSQQSYFGGFPSMPQGPVRNFQNFSQAHQQPYPLLQSPPINMPVPEHHMPQPSHTMGLAMPQPSQPQSQLPTPPHQPWAPTTTYQPHTIFQPRQPPRGKDMTGHPKHMSLPSRHQLPASQMQHLQYTGGSSDFPSTQAPAIPKVSSLGPATGFLPETYSQEHQRALSTQLPQAASGESRQNTYRIPELERPATRNCNYPNQPSAPVQGSGVGQMYFTSPMQENQVYGNGNDNDNSNSNNNNSNNNNNNNIYHRQTSSLSGIDSFNTMQKSPAMPIPAILPAKAKDAIFCQFAPRAVPWDGKDIAESVTDMTIGRRIVSRYALGMHREKYIREGIYIREKSPLFADSQTLQQKQQQQQLQHKRFSSQYRPTPQRHFTMDRNGNDRVILKYLKSKRDWEIDCVMTRYLTCHHPEVKLESQYMDYPQPQQHCTEVNPFVVGLYETFVHPHGSDIDGCRYLSILQWFPDSLQGFISDSIASGEGLEVTLPIVRNLIECVEYIHSRKVCHLNLKPSNFVRDPYAASSICRGAGSVGWKLVDFDAARIIDEEMVGRCTFSYASPEILLVNSKGKGVMAKASLDIWSLGLVIYELLTDKPLFQTDEHAKDVLLKNTIRPVRYYDQKNVLAEYWPLLDAMLAHDPEKRLSASQLLQLDLFTRPISPRPVPQDQLMRNNNIQTLRDLKAVRLCNLNSAQMENMERRLGNGNGNGLGHGNNNASHNGSMDSLYGSSQMMLLEGIGRVLDSPFDQVPRLFMLLPPMAQDLDPARPFQPSNLFQNQKLRLVLLCEGLSGYGEDAHMTDHRGYVLQDPTAFVQEVGKILLHLVNVAGTNNPGYETPALDRPLSLTSTPLDNCQRWFPSLRSYYEVLQGSIQRLVGPAPNLNELRSLRGPTLKQLEQWLTRLVRQQGQLFSESSNSYSSSTISRGVSKKVVSAVAQSDLISHAGFPLGRRYDDLSDELANLNMTTDVPEMPEVTGPGGGEGYGGLYKMPVGTCGDRWICRGCVSKLAMVSGSR
ncbi:hypothetical protein BG003_004255 [Podila horticola]|nr:hypothetical protein BG003_004255 [Podila horticola]